MPYITSIEKIAKAEGKAEGMTEGFRLSVKRMLKAKFGEEALDLVARIEEVTDVEMLSNLQEELCNSPSLSDLKNRYL